MSNSQEQVLFIPKKLRVGFKKRPKETADGYISYVIYFDEKNKIRKEKSFLNWCDNDIPKMDLENTEITGFRILTSIKRNPYHFGDATEKVRIYDPRGFEFEITMSNLIFLFDHGNLIDLEYKGKCVYSWNKGDLVLLPVNSIAYKKNTEKLELIHNKIKESEMVVGGSYSLKRSNEELIYLGKYFYLKSYHYCKNKEELVNVLDKLPNKNAITIKEYSAIDKERYIFLKVTTSNEKEIWDIEEYSSLSPIEELKKEDAMSIEEVDVIVNTTSFSSTPFNFVLERDQTRYHYCENEKYEFFLYLYHQYSSGYDCLVLDKIKKTVVKENNYSKEMIKYIEELKEKTKRTKEHVFSKKLKIANKLLVIS